VDEFGDVGPAIAVDAVKLDEQLFFFFGPFLFADAVFEVVVVALPALFAVAAFDFVLGFHELGNCTPFCDSLLFVKLS
jgi:hypothetical protein